MNIKINMAGIKDIEPLADLLYVLFSQEADFMPNREDQITGLKLLLDNPDKGFVLTAKENGEIVGMVSVLKVVSTAEGGEAGILEDMIIDPAHRGMGIGSALLSAALDRSKAENLMRLTLLTDATNDKAISFYEKSGFEKSAMIPMRLYFD